MWVWLLAVYGIADVVSRARIGAPLRALFPPDRLLGQLVRCPKCVGFWAGVALTFVGLGPATGPFAALLNGFAASAWCWVVYVVLVRLGAEEL